PERRCHRDEERRPPDPAAHGDGSSARSFERDRRHRWMLTTLSQPGHTQRIDEREVSIRASDADRERVARSLREHLMAGRLAADEFEQRIEGAYTAKTVDELRTLTRDLPEAQAKPQRPRRRLFPGNRPFAARFETST